MELSQIKGLKVKRIEMLNKAGIYTPEDLILHFPDFYADTMSPPDFSNMADGKSVAFVGCVKGKPARRFVRRGLSFVKAKFETLDGKAVDCTWFNQPYVYKQLEISSGGIFIVSGKVKKTKNRAEIIAPSLSAYKADSPKIIPLYKGIRGIPTSLFSEAVREVLDKITLCGYFDSEIINKYKLMPLDIAVRTLHNPESLSDIIPALRTVALENLAHTISVYNILKQNGSNSRIFAYKECRAEIDKLISSLPFKLTQGQNDALDDILISLYSPRRMNRLLQGDVGCGKTVVAFLAMYYAALSGYQSVLMAPTEILARQHYFNAVKLFENTGVNIELLTGGMDKTLRGTKLFNIKNGVSQIIIGTHALISENVEYNKLSLVITDEQHRFGVSQRAELENKSQSADILVMSATPIPRTLALTLYGDLEQSVIKTKPVARAEVFTRIVPENKLDDMYDYLKKNADSGLQTYIVCPRVDDEEDGITSAEKLYEELKAYFTSAELALLHGQMRERDKNAVMEEFAAGKIKILVTTTVIEVGVDVKNAVNIVIYDPDRYGLSQLHQLRGRVGRGEKTSYCFLVGASLEGEARERIEYFAKCSDGFELAEYDFYKRGAGDFLGTRQHGGSRGFGILNISPELLKTAKEISDYLVAVPKTRQEISQKICTDENDYIKSLTLN